MKNRTTKQQKFTYQTLTDTAGVYSEPKIFLLMPKEVEEFERIASECDLGFDYAFERITGKAIFDDYGNRRLFNIKLIIEIGQPEESKYIK